MNRIISLTKRNIKEIVREPISLFFMLVLPLIMEILFYLLFHNLTSQFEMKNLAPAMIGFANAFLCLFIAMLVASDRESAFITRIYTTPVKPYEFIFSYLLSIIPFGLLQSILILLSGIIIEPTMLSISLLLILILSLLSIIMFASLGVLFGSLFNSKAVGGISSIIICGQSILSGMWFPIDGINEGFINFMSVLPFRNISIIFRNITISNNIDIYTDLIFPIIIVSIYTIISLIISCCCFFKNSNKN